MDGAQVPGGDEQRGAKRQRGAEEKEGEADHARPVPAVPAEGAGKRRAHPVRTRGSSSGYASSASRFITITEAEKKMKSPWRSGRSGTVRGWEKSEPRPGHEKIASTRTAPDTTAPRCRKNHRAEGGRAIR